MNKNLIISETTKNNWEKLHVNEDEYISKLTKRANKLYSKKQFLPIEYLKDKSNLSKVKKIINYIKTTNYDIETLIYNLSLNILQKHNLIHIDKYITSKNKNLKNVLNEYKNKTICRDLIDIQIPIEGDILGFIYQSLMSEGNKNKKGSYYTPEHIINDVLNDIESNILFLDPCCGTGSFLLKAADKIKNPENIYGCDLDEIACYISKINLIIKYKDKDFMPQIYNINFLSEKTDEIFRNKKFDVITTNPPWGAMLTQIKHEIKKSLTNIVKSKESYSYFIVQVKNLLKENGKCRFVLPESILNVKTHTDIRKFILDSYSIEEIKSWGQAFSGVLTNVLTIKLSNRKSSKNIKIITSEGIKYVKQTEYTKYENNRFMLIDNSDAEIINRIFLTEHLTLKNSIWGLGIVTGDNNKHLSDNPKIGEKIYTGKNIEPYFIKDSLQYISYNREEFQQVASEDIYRAKEKLVYKFISKKPIFAYDDKQRLFLNSANILIPRIETHSIKTVMAFLNSTLFNYLYKNMFNELKILKGNLEELPFPILDEKIKKELENYVEKYIKIKDNKIPEHIDTIVYKTFSLSKKDIKIIKNK